MTQIELYQGDITKLKIDAIVNAANTTLLGGGGVDGAIHCSAGPNLLEECKQLNGCKTGEAKITKGYNLPVKFVIHTPGPVWRGGKNGEANLLAACYRNSLYLAKDNRIKSIAFPAISTGVYAFPLGLAAQIALKTVKDFVAANPQTLERVVFVVFSPAALKSYQEAIALR